jgi:hypothetical protein
MDFFEIHIYLSLSSVMMLFAKKPKHGVKKIGKIGKSNLFTLIKTE